MNLDVRLTDERGVILQELDDPGNKLSRLICRDDVAYPHLRFVDPIDTTVFTSFQMAAIVPELRRLAQARPSPVLDQVLE